MYTYMYVHEHVCECVHLCICIMFLSISLKRKILRKEIERGLEVKWRKWSTFVISVSFQ